MMCSTSPTSADSLVYAAARPPYRCDHVSRDGQEKNTPLPPSECISFAFRSNLQSVWRTPTDQPTTMEECPPGGDCASDEGDPSKSDNPPASWTANPAGEQAQGESER